MDHEADARRPLGPEERRRLHSERIRKRLEFDSHSSNRGARREDLPGASSEGASSSRSESTELIETGSSDFPESSARLHGRSDDGSYPNGDPLQMQLRLPGSAQKQRNWTRLSFILIVILPTLIASIYYSKFASNQYMSEFRFAVTQASPNGVSSSSTGMDSVGSILGGMGLPSGASNQNYIVIDYLTSDQAVEDLRIKSHIDVRKLYSRNSTDFLSRLKHDAPEEKVLEYWKQMVSTSYDPISGLAIVQIRAFSAQDAFDIAQALVKESEHIVNSIANRSKGDLVRFAEQQAKDAAKDLQNVRAQMDSFRRLYGVIDPTTNLVSSNAQVSATLQSSIAALETEIRSLKMQRVGVNAPTVQSLMYRLAATKKQLAEVQNDVSANAEKKSALAAIVGTYEKLNLQIQYAQTLVLSTRQGLDTARANAAAQSLYLTPYVRPHLPQAPSYPHRLVMIGLVGIITLAIWLTISMVGRAMADD